MVFLRNFLKSSRPSSLCFRRFASSTVKELKMHPDLYNGISTKYGWVLVKKTHVARGWTQGRIHEEFDRKLGDVLQKPDWETVQKIVDEWAETADISQIPQTSKKTGAQISKENELKLYLQQLRYELASNGSGTNPEEPSISSVEKQPKKYKKSNKDNITFTNAWNYYMTIRYSKYSKLLSKDARQKVGVEWRQLTLDEKEYYRQEYGKLLQLGKDILHGNIVDREVKDRASQKLWESKERTRLRKLGTLPPYVRLK